MPPEETLRRSTRSRPSLLPDHATGTNSSTTSDSTHSSSAANVQAAPSPSVASQPQASNRKRKSIALELDHESGRSTSAKKAAKGKAKAKAPSPAKSPNKPRGSASAGDLSSKALGKRRELSPSPPPTPPTNPAKRRRKEYNLRSQPLVIHDMPEPASVKGKGKKPAGAWVPSTPGLSNSAVSRGEAQDEVLDEKRAAQQQDEASEEQGDVTMQEPGERKSEAAIGAGSSGLDHGEVNVPLDVSAEAEQRHLDQEDSDGGSENDDDEDDQDGEDEDDEDDDEGDENLEDGSEEEIQHHELGADGALGFSEDEDDFASAASRLAAQSGGDPFSGASAASASALLDALEGGGSGFRALHGLMSGLSGRLKGLLTRLKTRNDAQAVLSALQELAELLGVATEDTLAGYFQLEPFVKEIVALLRGDASPPPGAMGSGAGGMTAEEMIAFGLDASEMGGGAGTEEDGVQIMLLACRCLANLMEALPGSAHAVVYAGAVPVLCEKLVEIQYIDLAEQTLSTLEKISEEVPSSIVREGGLGALLTFLDFFSFHVQRTAVTAAANCCRSLSPDSFHFIRDVIPILTNVLASPDQRVVEQACLAVVRTVESYRHHPDKLEAILTPDLLKGVRVLLNPDSTTVGPGTYTQVLKMLATATKASPAVAIKLLDLNLGETLYHLLTGVAPPEWVSDDGVQRINEEGEQGDRGTRVMQNLVQKQKDLVQETLNLVCELLPSLPKDGIFDSRQFSGKPPKKIAPSDPPLVVKREEFTPDLGAGSSGASAIPAADELLVKMEVAEEEANPTERRLSLLRGTSIGVRRYYALMLPTLVDVYAASVAANVRSKAVLGLLKIVEHCEAENLAWILNLVPMASFLGAILSSRDQASLITTALQLVELLLVKMPDAYQYFFRREGVMHEIERIASSPLVAPPKSKKRSPDRSAASSTSGSNISRQFQQQAASSSSTSLSPADAQAQDLITMRARHLRDKYASEDSEAAAKASTALEKICGLVKLLQEDQGEVLKQIAEMFADETNPMSSFELSESGLVSGLLEFATSARAAGLSIFERQELVAKAFMPQLDYEPATPAFACLVKRLQESLSRMEEFDVALAAQSTTDAESRRSGSMLARQLKLRLVAEDGTDVPRSCSNLVVSIHAIATFQAFNDYLRPRIIAATSLAERTSGSRSAPSSGAGTLSSFLAAFAAANGSSSPPDSSAVASGSGARLSSSLGKQSAAAATASSSSATAAPPTRRRSTRLSKSGNGAVGSDPAEPSGSLPKPEEQKATADALLEDLEASNLDGAIGHHEDDDEDMCQEDDDDEHDDEDELFPADFEQPPASRDERTVHLEIADDKLVAKTPDGTRVGTPTLGKSPSSSRLASTSKPRASYAAAVKAEPTDFHLEFHMAGEPVNLDTTVYGGVHKHFATSADSRRNIWQQVYTVTFRKVPGPPRPDSERMSADPISRDESMPTILPTSIATDSQQAKILQLLWVLHSINSEHGDSADTDNGVAAGIAEAAFVNNKLTAKLNRQLEEPMIVASACLPDWATDLPQSFPFLFPFETRYVFLQSTAFGYARLMQKWVGQSRSDLSRRDDNLGFLGRLQRQKVRISRERMLESALKVFELYGSSRASLEVEFFSEVGSGLGPTLEFYALVSKEFARKDLGLWRDSDPSGTSSYVFNPSGLFPSPLDDASTDSGKQKLKMFRVLGQFVAKALMDSRIIDVNFSRAFMKMVIGYELPLKITSIKHIDSGLASSLRHLERFVLAKKAVEAEAGLTEDERKARIGDVRVDDDSVADLALDFVLPGYEIDLKPNGQSVAVDIWNIEEYISSVVEWTLRKGVMLQMKEFKSGFTSVFPVQDLQSFTPTELVTMTGSSDEDWSVEGLSNATKADHGFTMDSRPVRDLLSVMSELDLEGRREFLSFITGAPRLPIGGFSALSPSLTIVRKDGGDRALPSVMTCVNYIKLPDYSTPEILKERVLMAVKEASGFHLS